MRQNTTGLLIIVGIVTLIDLSRYFSSQPILTATAPPQFIQYLVFLAATILLILVFTLSRAASHGLLHRNCPPHAILVILKSPALSLQASILLRTLTDRPTETASALDLRWLGISYIAFRLIHVLRDKQTERLPELSLPEFATYVVFFPALAAGPIDRAERFAKDLQKNSSSGRMTCYRAGKGSCWGCSKNSSSPMRWRSSP
jgi:alginate O-acetyltransferase complex protein AlgI